MDSLTTILPITVIAAIALFVVKEVVEGSRRWRANTRERRAFRTLLARECELNNWTYKRLKEALLLIQEDFETEVTAEYAIQRLHSGDEIFLRQRDGRKENEWPLPAVRTDLMSKLMLDVAIQDQSLFALLQAAYDSASNMRHIRQSLIRFIETDDKDHKNFFTAFPDYALATLTEILADLEKLYKECSGKELKDFRIR